MTDRTRTIRSHCKKSAKHLPLPAIYDACETLHMLTLLSTLVPLRVDAGRCTDASRLRRQPFGCGIRCQRAPGRSVTSPPCLL